jgi:microcystin-dependent protein
MGISSGLAGAVGAVPVGVVNPFAGSTAPSGWLLCAGQAVSRSEYSALFATISTTYGTGDGSTTFNVPDMRGRVAAGKDDMGGSAASRLTSTVLSASNTLGATGGSQTHTLTSGQSGVPAHGHGITDPGHLHGTTQGIILFQGSFSSANAYSSSSTSATANYNTNSATTGITVNNNTAANASEAHTNTQPTIVLNYIIKAA